MLKSMTGFGRGEYLDNEYRLVVEIKAVNHRYNEIVIRMPKNLNSLEDKIRRIVSTTLVRGRIDVFITMEEYGQKKRTIRVDKELAIAYHESLKQLAELFEMPAKQDIHRLASYPDVIRAEEVMEDAAMLWPKLAEALEQAVGNLVHMRLAEGLNIKQDLEGRVAKIGAYIEKVEAHAPQVVADYREKILGRMRDLLATIGAEPDEGRLLQETAVFADRTSITEEIVRLKSHMLQIGATLNADDAVGRKLDFIVQEINRETNTIASKANDFSIATIMVEIKSEIEKIREQIQNIE